MAIQNWSNDVTVVELGEEPLFTDEINAVMDALNQRPVNVIVNFSAVGFLNSSNLARLLRLRKLLLGVHRRLVFCGASAQVANIFLVTGLDKIFEFTNDIATALAMLQMASAGSPAGNGAKPKNDSARKKP